MPISQSAKKALRKSIKNRRVRVQFKRSLDEVVGEFKKKPSEENLRKVSSVLDKAVKIHLYHHNKAARIKSKLSKSITKKAEMEVSPKSGKKPKKATK